jgi:hypothetical protein
MPQHWDEECEALVKDHLKAERFCFLQLLQAIYCDVKTKFDDRTKEVRSEYRLQYDLFSESVAYADNRIAQHQASSSQSPLETDETIEHWKQHLKKNKKVWETQTRAFHEKLQALFPNYFSLEEFFSEIKHNQILKNFPTSESLFAVPLPRFQQLRSSQEIKQLFHRHFTSLLKSSVIVGTFSCIDDTSGHAIFFQISPEIYRFYDIAPSLNGFYEFDSEDAFYRGFYKHLRQYYLAQNKEYYFSLFQEFKEHNSDFDLY